MILPYLSLDKIIIWLSHSEKKAIQKYDFFAQFSWLNTSHIENCSKFVSQYLFDDILALLDIMASGC